MKLIDEMRLFALATALSVQLFHPAPAADRRDAPTMELDAVALEDSRLAVEASGEPAAVGQRRFSGATAHPAVNDDGDG